MTITGYSKCNCGAITVVTDEDEYSCAQTKLREYFPAIDLRTLERFQTTYCCNHCINHYGLDLCGCGSGELFGNCDNDLDECEKPMQVVGEYTRVISACTW